MRLLVKWLVNALGLFVVAWIVPGFAVHSFVGALIAVLVIGLVNATLGTLLKIVTFPLTILTLGIFWWIINALMLWFAAAIVPGCLTISGFGAALFGAIVLAVVNVFLHWVLRKASDE